MPAAWRPAIVACCLLAGAVGASSCGVMPRAASDVEAGVWFEPVRFRSAELDGAITADDLVTVETTTRLEIARAFDGLRVRITTRRDAPYRVRIVESVRDPRFRSHVEVAGASWGGAGHGHGVVSFTLLASGALAHAPTGADRGTKLQTIGRGLARSVVHELAHQFFPADPIHSDDVESYEFPSASRPAQYQGVMRWSRAWPLLEARFGNRKHAGAPTPPGL
jgi:hypothetical protein